LDSESLAHHWTAASEDLEVGHGAATRRNIVGGSGAERAQRGWRGLFEKRTNRTRLAEKGFHVFIYFFSKIWDNSMVIE
jgi:hypothetical protein